MAVVQAMKAAVVPTRVVADCQSVVNLVRDEIDGNAGKIHGDHADLWAELRTTIQSRASDYYAIDWVNSHIPLEAAEDLEAAGGFERRHVEGNHGADRDASDAMREHPIDWAEYAAADDRMFLAIVAQSLIETVWQQVFDEDLEMKKMEDDDGDNAGVDEGMDIDLDHDGGNGDEIQGGFDLDPIDFTNKHLAQHIRGRTPEYAWHIDAGTPTRQVRFPDLPHEVPLKRTGKA
jgi:hypothetical protein